MIVSVWQSNSLETGSNLLLCTFVNIQTPISKLAEAWRTNALVGPERVDTLELAVVLARGALVLVLAGLAI